MKATLELQQLVGYFPKATAVPGDWSVSDQVAEICSVSGCINSSPENWVERWLHNELGFFNTRADARAVLPAEAGWFSVFAYRLLPLRFARGRTTAMDIPQLPVEPLTPDFVSLGFDVVSRSISSFFECSPLSCNSMAAEIPVNRFCLVDTLSEAVAVAQRFSREEPEPGPYYVIEVLREQAAG